MGGSRVHVAIMNENTNQVSVNIESVSKNIVHFANTRGEGYKSRQKITMRLT